MAVKASNGKDPILDYRDVGAFSVAANLENYGFKGEFQTMVAHATPVIVPYEWQLPDGTVAPVALNTPVSVI